MSTVDSSPPDVPGYLLHTVLGEGGSSVVWSAVDAAGVPVAVKVPRPGCDVDGDPAAAERQVLAAVRHPHLVALRDVVGLPDARTALVFDRVTGASLRSMVRARGQLRPGETVTILTPICQAVAALHAAGALHADISPGNIMLTADGRPLLLDLGAARLMGQTEAAWGTSGFIAPELRDGAGPTSASDVFSLGAVAWFCLTGNGAPDTAQRLDPDTVRSHVGPELADVISASIDPDPGARPDAARLARLVYEAVQPESIEVVMGDDDASALTHRLRAEAALEPPAAPRGRRRRIRRSAVVAGLVAGVLLGGGCWFLVSRPLAPAGATPGRGEGTTARPGGAVVQQMSPTRSGTVPAQDDPAAPQHRTMELLQWLSDQRARALVDRATDRLSAVHRSGSASHASDVRLIEALEAGGHRYADLRLSVAEASWVSGDAEHATVRARVDWSAYTVVDRTGARRGHPAASGELLDFELRWDGSAWRIEHISDAGSS
ncbi:serine/threonine-protein kinase [Intrasporangium sp. DVR]|uniref:serine/threonine-protein kinase n=1 Tax=Intrasporangium sp. DVR TaxID=3127867 RepID=UPI00313A567D